MKRFDSKSGARFLQSGLSAVPVLALGAAALLPLTATGTENVVQQNGPVSYVSGGVADDGLDQLKAMSKDFNLKMVFALKSGAFLSDVDVAIIDARGNPVLATTTEGPWLLAKLPAGNYQVIASEAGNSIRQKIAVGSGKLSTLDFRWSSE
jgi:hypothetical protein